MKLQASVGNTSRQISLNDSIYSLRLVAQSHGEKQLLAGLFKALKDLPPSVLREKPPVVKILITKAEGR